MRSERTYEVGERVLIEVDPKNHDVRYGTPMAIIEAIVTGCSDYGNGKDFSISVETCEHEKEAIRYHGKYAPSGGIVHPLTSRGMLVRYQNLRRESDADLASANARSRTLLEALGAVGKGLGDDIRASLARIEATLAGSR